MALTRHEVENIAHLARLRISDDEIPGYVDNLSRIIDFVAHLDAAQTDHVQTWSPRAISAITSRPMPLLPNAGSTWCPRSSNSEGRSESDRALAGADRRRPRQPIEARSGRQPLALQTGVG